MSLTVTLQDRASRRAVIVDRYGALKTAPSVPELLPEGVKNRYQFFRTSLTGMNVNGSVTPVTFTLSANAAYDIFITHVLIVVADGTSAHNTFGSLAALTNGWDLVIQESGIDTYLIQAAKTAGQLIVQSELFSPYGTGADVGEIINWTGTADATVVRMDIKDFVPGGLRLGRKSIDSIRSVVRDNLTTLDEFTVYMFGYKHVE